MTKIKGINVTDSQAAVYNVLRHFPRGLADNALVPLAQHQMGIRQASSGIRTRRAELVDLGLVIDTNRRVRTPSGRKAVVYGAAGISNKLRAPKVIS